MNEVRLIDANALKEDFMNDFHNYMMESLRENYHDVMRISEVIQRIEDAPTIEAEPVTWYTADENQPDSAGDDVLIVDRDDEYCIAYYCSKGNWIDTNTGNPIEVVKWRYLRWDNDDELFDADMKKAVIGIDIYVENMPSADVQPVKHGRWIDNGMVYTCSECNSSVPKNIFVIGCDFKGCPYCFAKMSSDKDNNARSLTDEETTVYESWIESKAKDTGINIIDGDNDGKD